MRVLLVTGGAGFIGSNFIRYFLRRNKNFIIINIDKLGSQANLNNLKDLEQSPRYHFIKGDICNQELIQYILRKNNPEFIINFAAETSPIKELQHPTSLVETNILGTMTLMDCARHIWQKNNFTGCRFIQVSTADVYGNIPGNCEYLLEECELMPDTPFAATKASADLMIRSYVQAYGFPAVITRSCDTYGPYQSMDHTLPLWIHLAMKGDTLPIQDDGSKVREYIHVQDHCIALIRTLFYSKPGEIYNIGTGEEISSIGLAQKVLRLLGKPEDGFRVLNEHTLGSGRLCVNSYKMRSNLGWSSKYNLDEGIKETIQWYKTNKEWWERKQTRDMF